jgi:phenylpropionate dioxygenase-like ring-hydroxylating dioxygenase large terminal subunit
MDSREIGLLRRLWFPVARSQDVGSAPVQAELLGDRLVLFRARGAVTVARDRCPHRGARLSLGRVMGEVLECPYHGWQWAADGRCALVPSQPTAQPNARLAIQRVQEQYGLVWVCLDEPLLTPPTIPEIDLGTGWESAFGEVFDVRCGLRSITENFRDSSHFAFVHRETFGDVSPEIPAYEVRRDGWTLEWDLTVTFGSRWEADGVPDGSPKYRFGETEGDNGLLGSSENAQPLHYRFAIPSLAYVHTKHHGAERLICQIAAPLERDGTRSRVFFFVAADAAFRQQQGDLATQVEIESRVFAEDVPIVESLDPAEAPLELQGQAHVRADRYSVAYRRMFADLLEWFASDQQPGRRSGPPAGASLGIDLPAASA